MSDRRWWPTADEIADDVRTNLTTGDTSHALRMPMDGVNHLPDADRRITDPRQAADIHDRLFDDSYIGCFAPDDALYAAEQVFARAAARGHPIPRTDQ